MRHAERALQQLQRGAACKLAYGSTLLACALLAGFAVRGEGGAAPAAAHAEWPTERPIEWPTEWEGRPLRPLAPSEVERRFAARFPGAIARFDNGGAQLVLRRIDEPTRMLHPAADCYRGVGWRIGAQRLEHDAHGQRWRCFDALRDGQRLRVCERIVGADGTVHTDASSWFWDAVLGRSRGPWQAVTIARAV